MTQTRLAASLAALLLATPALAAPSGSLLPDALLTNTPVGTWKVRITTFDCATLKAGPPFESLLAFGIEGNESETTSNPMLQPGQRTPAFGSWHFTGPRSVALTTKAYILFPSPAGPIRQGSQVIHHTIRMLDDHSFADRATIAYYDTAGAQVLGGCAVAEGQRL